MESTHTRLAAWSGACAEALPLCAERRMLQRRMGLARCLGSSVGLDVGGRLKMELENPNVGSVIWR